MDCKYCGETDESKLVMRTESNNGEIETVYICNVCLGKKFDAKTNLTEKEYIF